MKKESLCPDCNCVFVPYKRSGVKVSKFCKFCKATRDVEKRKKARAKATKARQIKRKKEKKELSEKTLDNLWAKATKIHYGGKCEICGKTEYINSHHIYSRSNRAIRWDIDNCSLLCPSHHTFSTELSAHKAPMNFADWIIDKRGLVWYKRLRRKARGVKPDRLEIKEYLENIK